ncbi:MAG: serine/threonine-protein kinase, partial [Gemmatimonadaceae bacterium]
MSTFEERLKTALSPAYEIERELTGGGMSHVFVATDIALGRKIVVKVLPPELTAGVNRERFRREIQVAAQLQHPHIVTLLSAGEDGDLLYYTMPFIEGDSLKFALENGPLSVREVVRILHDVVDALAYAHARGVVHRDIKPGNVLRQGSHALVTDFGVAKALNAALPVSGVSTTTGMVIGTPAYMAPEQLAGDPSADHRIDIYAVGLLAYELLTGESPFTGPSPQATMAAQLTRDPEPLYICCPDVPPPLSAIIMQCLAKTPEQRPPSAEALMAALDAITSSSGEIKGPSGRIGSPPARGPRSGVGIGITAVVLVSAVALFGLRRDENQSPPPAGEVSAAAAVAPPTSAAATVSANAGPPPVPVAAPVAPALTLTRADSLAIAEAVRKRLAAEEMSRGRQHVAMISDSITAYVRKIAIDSIVKANLPPGMPMTVFRDASPALAFGKRRVVITEPRQSGNAAMTIFGKAFADSLGRALSKRPGFTVVDADSVRGALAVSRVRSYVEKSLKPDLLVTPTLAGNGDTLAVIVTIRDVKNSLGFGTRVASSRVAVASPDASIGPLVQAVL